MKNAAIIEIIASIAPLFVVCIGFVRKRFFNETDKVLLSVMVLSMITELVGQILDILFKKHNIIVLNSYTLIETILLSIFYSKVLTNKRINVALIIFSIFFLVVFIWEMFNSNLSSFNHISMSLESVWIIFLSFFTFRYLMNTETDIYLTKNPIFWFNTGLLIFFSGNLFINLFSKYSQTTDVPLFIFIWNIYSFLTIIQYVLISIGFLKTKYRIQ